MELSGFLNNITLTLENAIGSQIKQGEFRLGALDLQLLLEIQPLNQRYEALLLCCEKCGKTTAFLSLKSLDHYIDDTKKSILQCRHCQFKMQVPKIQKIRDMQEKEYNFLQVQDWQFTKILSKKGRLIKLMMADQKIQFQYMEYDTNNTLEIEVPQNKMKLLQKLKIQQIYRFKIKVFELKKIDLQKIFFKKSDQNPAPLKTFYKYQLISLSRSKH